MMVNSRRAAIIATLFLIAGCSGGTLSQSPSLASSANAVVHRGVPLALPMLHATVRPQKRGQVFHEKILSF